ncbi:MAG: ATP-dependent zinc metalloprotease FtsH [Alphaproteobacteria bacterium]|nr:ATP-dependent zinc metalloprotease FtsH [Alphaproteobacteria bacterium]
MNDKETHINFWYFVAAILLLLMIQSWLIGEQTVETVSYSEFQRLLDENKIEEIAISEHHIRGKLKETPSDGRRHIYTVRVDPDFARDLKNYDVKFTGTVENTFVTTLLSWIVPALVFVGVWMFFIRNMAGRQGFGGLMSIGKSKAKVAVEKDIDVTFDDVAGVDEAKEELREIVKFLRDPKAYGRLGARVPKGVLLVGPPGTGKTLLARAVAGEAKVTFFSINGSEFVEMFVGVGAARVRDLFEQARRSAPCIIFIDEIDALGRARVAAPISGGADEKEQTLNQLLAELDGFDPSTGVVLLAATNRPEILDIALLRAGRFDRQILIDRPDKDGREQILRVHMRKIVLASDVDAETVALLTAGFSGADLANLVNEAAILATRRGGDAVNADDFTRAIERIVAGLEKKSRVLSPNERKVVAYHEIGHALVTLALPGTETVQKISIIPRGIGSLGYTIQRPTEDRYLMTRDELENKMASLMGGRAAEALVFGEISTGAQDDLEKVTEIARGMVMRYGMDEALGQATYGQPRPLFLPDTRIQPPETRNYSEQTASQIDEAVRHLVDRAFERASEVLRRNRDLLDRDAKLLLERETLTADDIGKPVGLDNLAAVAGAKPAE